MNRKYPDSDRELAELLGWTDVVIDAIGAYGLPPQPNAFQCVAGEGSRITIKMHTPRWCLDDAAAFKLQIKYNIKVNVSSGGVIQTSYAEHREEWSFPNDVNDHPDTLTAARYSIVKAVIAKITKKPRME